MENISSDIDLHRKPLTSGPVPEQLCVDWPGILLAAEKNRKVHWSPCGQALSRSESF